MHQSPCLRVETNEDYAMLAEQLHALIEDSPVLSALSNASALLWEALTNINWVGFYLAKDGHLLLGPFQGKPACITIAFGKGVCGTAAATREIQLVENVHEFPGHIACDSASNSEIVLPLIVDDVVVGVLDIDSPIYNRFSTTDSDGLQQICRVLISSLDWSCGLL